MLSKKIGIDLGTANVVVYVKGDGVVLNEPALLALDGEGGRILALGRAAQDLLARSSSAHPARPVRDGSVVDYGLAGALLQHVVGRVCGRQRIFRPDVMISVPSTVTGVERRAVLEATMQAGARTAYLIEKPLAAALGAGLRIAHNAGVGICHIGAGSTEVAVVAEGEMVSSGLLAVGGEAMDRALAEWLLRGKGVRVEDGEAERLKTRLGAALANGHSSLSVAGRDTAGEPITLDVDAAEVSKALMRPLGQIAANIDATLRQAPENARAAVKGSGVVLTGGAAQLGGLDVFLASKLGVPVHLAANPQACVAVGTGLALENLQLIRRGQHYIA